MDPDGNAALFCKLHRIVHQIHNDSADFFLIPQKPAGNIGVTVHDQSDTPALFPRHGHCHNIGNGGCNGIGFFLQIHPSLLKLGKIQNIIDQ